MSEFCSIEQAIKDIRDGKIVIVVDDAERENEGDMVFAAEMVTPALVNFLARHARGLICTPLTPERATELDLEPMVSQNTCKLGTAFTVSIDKLGGTTTGISAHDRAATIHALVETGTQPHDFARPGHIFPLIGKPGGVLRRAGHTEASIDLARLAGLAPVGVLCEVLDEDGSMARMPRLIQIADEMGLNIVTIADLIAYRRRTEKLVERVKDIRFPTESGEFRLHLYRSLTSGHTHLALTKGTIDRNQPTLVRVHSQCLTGDVFGSLRCDCGPQLQHAMEQVEAAGNGVIVYLSQEGRGIGLENKILAYALQDQGHDTVEANEALGFPADLRDYGLGAQMLVDLGVGKIRLMTNNPRKLVGLSAFGLEIVDRVPIEILANDSNRNYLAVKRDKLGHLLNQALGATGKPEGVKRAE
ncbi:MAG TPA: bifunctional 3,4-dihydroxy-2-butanone-4-phosphate synthase/GTP cyclohydrolase II [Candidatus Krumholzibacteria bacterium]|nr:bifunctional 3,4-dihydroxy-2-butanone-4-phosphate synthase/GTP cyclohydrolase II [Candidatus Krumholzibacteria bacterium]